MEINRDLFGDTVIESGSNSNGTGIKYSNGLMIITQKYVEPSHETFVNIGTLYRVGLNAPPNFPKSFITPPTVFITLTNCWLGGLMGTEVSASNTNATDGHFVPLASYERRTFDKIEVNILAIGRGK